MPATPHAAVPRQPPALRSNVTETLPQRAGQRLSAVPVKRRSAAIPARRRDLPSRPHPPEYAVRPVDAGIEDVPARLHDVADHVEQAPRVAAALSFSINTVRTPHPQHPGRGWRVCRHNAETAPGREGSMLHDPRRFIAAAQTADPADQGQPSAAPSCPVRKGDGGTAFEQARREPACRDRSRARRQSGRSDRPAVRR
jgi:hypothetical protein